MRRLTALPIALCVLIAVSASAKNGAFRSTLHGDPVKGPQRKTSQPRGSCVQCHDGHASHKRTAGAEQSGLFASNDQQLCFTCHATPADGFPGDSVFSRSAHGTASSMRPRGAAIQSENRCGACHDPHGVRDSRGVIPAMLSAREPDVCIACHDGSNGADIRTALLAPYRHAQDARGEHQANENGDPSAFAWGATRHASCSDCHNSHVATASRGMASGPDAFPLLAGVSRVEVTNGAAGTVPNYTWRAADDLTPAREYEICFKCHSSWTKQPASKADLAVLTNPANASSHPIQAEGKNRNIDPLAFVNGFSAQSMVRCTDCHGSDNHAVRGPHGSSYAHLLRKPVAAAGEIGSVSSADLCFDCHSYATYADASADEVTQRASRFNAPATAGHTFHAGIQKIPCAGCHTVHGSARSPALIGRAVEGGITTYVQTPSGGSCGTTCHGMKTYAVNYSR